MTLRQYPAAAIERARDGALSWLQANKDGCPRSRRAEEEVNEILGHEMYDNWEAPPILGYEMLEREGLAVREEPFMQDNEERIRFRLSAK